MTKSPSFAGKIRHSLMLAVVCPVLTFAVQTTVQAEVVGNKQLAAESSMQVKRGEVATFMAREDVRQTLLGLGVDGKNVSERVNNLTDAQVLQIHDHIQQMPAGGDALGLVVMILLIFILLDIAGVTDVFPGIGPHHR